LFLAFCRIDLTSIFFYKLLSRELFQEPTEEKWGSFEIQCIQDFHIQMLFLQSEGFQLLHAFIIQ